MIDGVRRFAILALIALGACSGGAQNAVPVGTPAAMAPDRSQVMDFGFHIVAAFNPSYLMTNIRLIPGAQACNGVLDTSSGSIALATQMSARIMPFTVTLPCPPLPSQSVYLVEVIAPAGSSYVQSPAAVVGKFAVSGATARWSDNALAPVRAKTPTEFFLAYK